MPSIAEGFLAVITYRCFSSFCLLQRTSVPQYSSKLLDLSIHSASAFRSKQTIALVPITCGGEQ